MKEIKGSILSCQSWWYRLCKAIRFLSVFGNLKFLFSISKRVNSIFLSLWKFYCLKFVSLSVSFMWKGKWKPGSWTSAVFFWVHFFFPETSNCLKKKKKVLELTHFRRVRSFKLGLLAGWRGEGREGKILSQELVMAPKTAAQYCNQVNKSNGSLLCIFFW